LHQTGRLPGSQRLGDPPQLTGNDPETEQNQAADNGGRAGTDERISETEFVDRNTKSDHHQACKQGKRTDAIQYSRHALSIPPATFAVTIG
jgi:mono/diheme cytochrome c family protein